MSRQRWRLEYIYSIAEHHTFQHLLEIQYQPGIFNVDGIDVVTLVRNQITQILGPGYHGQILPPILAQTSKWCYWSNVMYFPTRDSAIMAKLAVQL